ncbi:MAG: hypothetical protein ABJF04_16055 [Reichenbachiella sp.]|uniref:mechanosensitive ion channel family protein n=1 Tax=Reichenbachiella sp. TaxID=2184521 RepID=UPI0032645FA9
MEKITNWTQIAMESLLALGQKIMTELPNIIGAIFLIVLGWVIAKIVSFVIRKSLGLIKFDKLSEKVNLSEMLEKANIITTPSKIVAKFVYWVIILLFFVTASDTLGWSVVSESISDLISYLPKLFSAIVIFVIGFYIANLVRGGLRGILESLSVTSGTLISTFAFYLIVTIITLTALNQAGVDTAVITSNVTLILGGIILAFAISFGLGSRDVLINILSSFYSKENFEVGQKIEMGQVKGEIEKLDRISCILKTTDGKVVFPAKRLISEEVKITS